MDTITIIISLLLIYIIWTLINTISSLQNEIKEMKQKCIKEVYKNKPNVLEENTKDPKKIIMNLFKNFF
jgi:predicted Holliday junction resolvase-like endonuclease